MMPWLWHCCGLFGSVLNGVHLGATKLTLDTSHSSLERDPDGARCRKKDMEDRAECTSTAVDGSNDATDSVRCRACL